MMRCPTALAIAGAAVVLASCTAVGAGRGPAPSTQQTVSYPLAPTQLVGRTFDEAAAVLRSTTIATSQFGKPFRGPETFRRTAEGTITPIATTDASALTVAAATFLGSSSSPMDDVRVGLLLADDAVASPRPGSKEYRELKSRLLDAMKPSPRETTVVTYLWVEGGQSIDDAFWRFIDRAVGSMPLTRDATTALVGRELRPLAPSGSGRYGAPDGRAWVDGVHLDGVVVTQERTSNSWVHTGFDIAARSQVCAVNIEDVLRSRYTVTPSKADDVHGSEPTPHRATTATGVIDFYLSTDCITSVTIAPPIR